MDGGDIAGHPRIPLTINPRPGIFKIRKHQGSHCAINKPAALRPISLNTATCDSEPPSSIGDKLVQPLQKLVQRFSMQPCPRTNQENDPKRRVSMLSSWRRRRSLTVDRDRSPLERKSEPTLTELMCPPVPVMGEKKRFKVSFCELRRKSVNLKPLSERLPSTMDELYQTPMEQESASGLSRTNTGAQKSPDCVSTEGDQYDKNDSFDQNPYVLPPTGINGAVYDGYSKSVLLQTYSEGDRTATDDGCDYISSPAVSSHNGIQSQDIHPVSSSPTNAPPRLVESDSSIFRDFFRRSEFEGSIRSVGRDSGWSSELSFLDPSTGDQATSTNSDTEESSFAPANVDRLNSEFRANEWAVRLRKSLNRAKRRCHLYGESQKISYLMKIFQEVYCAKNRNLVARMFCNEETVEVLAYSTLMLHTDLHNPNVRRFGQRMTQQEFINNNRGIDNGQDLPLELLCGIYHRVAKNEFKTLPDPMDRMRRLDSMLVGTLKTDNFIQRHRRFVGWVVGRQLDRIVVRPSRHHKRWRYILLFNDILIVSKLVSGAHSGSSGSIWHNAASVALGQDAASASTLSKLKSSQYFSQEPMTLGVYQIRAVLPLKGAHVLVFETQLLRISVCLTAEATIVELASSFCLVDHRHGACLCNDEGPKLNFTFPSANVRQKFIDWVHVSVSELHELQTYYTKREKMATLTKSSLSETSSISAVSSKVQPVKIDVHIEWNE
ncbi:Sec7 domain protein, partial [Opisthorchis viverrini]